MHYRPPILTKFRVRQQFFPRKSLTLNFMKTVEQYSDRYMAKLLSRKREVTIPLLTRHANTAEGAWIVQAGAIILARVRLTLIHIGLTAWSRETLRAVAGKRARCVHAVPIMFAWRPLFTLVDVLTAVDSLVAAGARACIGAIDGASVTDRICMARIGRAGVIQMAQQPCGKGGQHGYRLWTALVWLQIGHSWLMEGVRCGLDFPGSGSGPSERLTGDLSNNYQCSGVRYSFHSFTLKEGTGSSSETLAPTHQTIQHGLLTFTPVASFSSWATISFLLTVLHGPLPQIFLLQFTV